MYLLGVDIGTYSSKGVLVDGRSGQEIASHVIEHDLLMPHPGWAEHDPEKVWWGEFAAICHHLVSTTGIDPTEIKGIGVSGIGICVLPVDAQGRPLRNGILYGVDTRASKEIDLLNNELGENYIFQTSGAFLSSSMSGPKILWIKNHEPEVFEKARWFLTSHSYIILRLTGKATIDNYSACACAPMIDIENKCWNEKATSAIASIDSMPELLWSTEIAGTVNANAAKATGLSVGTPVVAGTIDAAAEALSAGLSEDGDMMMMFGSSNSIILKSEKLIRTKDFWALNWMHSGSYAVVGGMSTVGSLTRWFRDNLAQQELQLQELGGPNAYASMAELAAQSPAGANGLIALPYFEGERTPFYDPSAKGVLFGLSLKHSRADIYRALLESVGFGIRHNIESLRAEGLAPKRILAVGGGTYNLAWMQIISDIANVELIIPEKQIGSCYGDALLAAVGVGILENLQESAQWISYKHTIHPNQEHQEIYHKHYQIFLKLYQKTKHLMIDLTEKNI